MSGSLLSSLVGWVASHLVALGLLGFLFAGLQVFGVLGPSGAPGTESSVAVESAGAVRDAAVMPTPALGPVESARQGEPQGSVRDNATAQLAPTGETSPRRKTPKLIGGSLPVYEQSRFGSPVEEPAVPAVDEGFRPRAEEPSAEVPPPTRDDLVQQARRAFWNGDFEAAEAAYMALVTAYPEDADGFGELGNLYQSMGRTDAALDAYFEAGLRLKAIGETEKLSKIIDLMTREGDSRIQQLAP